MADSTPRKDAPPKPAADPGGEVTILLREWQDGDAEAFDRLVQVVDAQLRGLAKAALRGEAPGHTLQTTALINEAYIRLLGPDRSWEGSSQFMSVAARAMRRVLVDYARRRKSAKRGGGQPLASLDTLEPLLAGEARAGDLIDLDDALERLFALHERPARALELHYFGGLSYAEVADVLEISSATVQRDLRFARAWLFTDLQDEEAPHER